MKHQLRRFYAKITGTHYPEHPAECPKCNLAIYLRNVSPFDRRF